MADKYVPNTDVSYDDKASFLAGENIPTDLHDYFEEYDPAREDLLQQQAANAGGEHELNQRKARFTLNNQKRQLLSQSGKMGFASSGQMDKGMGDLMSMFEQEQKLVSEAEQINQTGLALDIDDTKREWLNAQYSMAGSLADEITDGNRNVTDIAKDIHGSDGHWEMSILDNYYDNSKERKFLAYMDDVGKSEWDNWKSWNRSSKKELSNRYKKSHVQAKADSYKDPGKA